MSDALDASLRLVRAQTALVRRFDARLGGLPGGLVSRRLGGLSVFGIAHAFILSRARNAESTQ